MWVIPVVCQWVDFVSMGLVFAHEQMFVFIYSTLVLLPLRYKVSQLFICLKKFLIISLMQLVSCFITELNHDIIPQSVCYFVLHFHTSPSLYSTIYIPSFYL